MADEKPLSEIVKTTREIQIKYCYYILALNVAVIAFALNQTKDEVFNDFHYMLGIAAGMWSLGIMFGFRYLAKHRDALFADYNIMNIERTVKEDSTIAPSIKYPTAVKLYSAGRVHSENVQTKANRSYRAMLYFFYFGCLAFIVWHIYQMMFFNGKD